MKRQKMIGDERQPNTFDRLCDECGEPMIGIMKQSEPAPPRKICAPCGGSPRRSEAGAEEA